METGTLVKQGTSWSLTGSVSTEVPEALERVIRSRVDRLPTLPREVVTASSVFGAEFPLSALAVVTDKKSCLPAAVAELCDARLLTEVRQLPEPVYRFRHGLIQEAIYGGLLRGQRRQLHARAAWGLEAAWAERLEEVAAVVGHHFAMAGESQRAVHYLAMAGDHAASGFANDEAMASYRYALELADDYRAGRAMARDAIELRAKLAQLLWHTGRLHEARAALEDALDLVDPEDSLLAARLWTRLGRVEQADHRYDAATAAFDSVDALLGEDPGDQDQARVDVWLEAKLDGRAYVQYWRNEPEKAAATLEAARPVVEARGSQAQKQKFYVMFVTQRIRQTRYRMDDEILSDARAAVAAGGAGISEYDQAWALFVLGFCLLWCDDLDGARRHMDAALAMVERVGDVVMQARCLSYLTVTALRNHDVEAVRSLVSQALTAAEAAGYSEFVAAAKAMMAWVAWRAGRQEEVVPLAHEALELWGTTVVSYSWYWLCLWPLIGVHLNAGRVAEAVATSRLLLAPAQQRLPDDLEAAVTAVAALWDGGEHKRAAEKLSQALDLAWRSRYA